MDVSQHIWTRRPLLPEKLALRVIGIALMLISPIAIYFASGYYAESRNMANWPHTDGIITRHNTHGLSNSGKGKCHLYITYEYEFHGKRFNRDRAGPGTNEVTETQRAALISRFPIGSTQRVYYAPSNPSRAYLIPGMETSALVALIASWGLLIGGLALVAASRPPPLVLRDQETWFEKWFVNWGWRAVIAYMVLVAVVNFTAIIFLPPPEEDGMTWLQLVTLTPIWLLFLGAGVHWIVGRLR
jgi:hypothetical protein